MELYFYSAIFSGRLRARSIFPRTRKKRSIRAVRRALRGSIGSRLTLRDERAARAQPRRACSLASNCSSNYSRIAAAEKYYSPRRPPARAAPRRKLRASPGRWTFCHNYRPPAGCLIKRNCDQLKRTMITKQSTRASLLLPGGRRFHGLAPIAASYRAPGWGGFFTMHNYGRVARNGGCKSRKWK